jgi:hypothetical protein
VAFAPFGKPLRGDKSLCLTAELGYLDSPHWITSRCGPLHVDHVDLNGERRNSTVLDIAFLWKILTVCLNTQNHARMPF